MNWDVCYLPGHDVNWQIIIMSTVYHLRHDSHAIPDHVEHDVAQSCKT